MRLIYHPTIAGITAEVHAEEVDAWKDAGWRLTEPKYAEPQPTTATTAGGDTTKGD